MGQMNDGCVLDSNILIYHVNGGLDSTAETVVFSLLEGSVYISVISRIEVLAWKGHSRESRRMTEELIRTLSEIGLDEPVIEAAIAIRGTGSVKLPDAIIAASAICLGLPLVTRNTSDFEKVAGLRLINPFEPGRA